MHKFVRFFQFNAHVITNFQNKNLHGVPDKTFELTSMSKS